MKKTTNDLNEWTATSTYVPERTNGQPIINANERQISKSAATTPAPGTARSPVRHVLSRSGSGSIYWHNGTIRFPRLFRHFQYRLLGDVHALNILNSSCSNVLIILASFSIWFIALFLTLYHNVHWCTVHNSRHFYSLLTSLLCSFCARVTTSRKIMQLNTCVKP